MIRNLHLRYVFLCLLLPFFTLGNNVDPNINLADIIGNWTVQSIEFSDCPNKVQDSSLDMHKTNCFTTIDQTELCVVMTMEFKSDGYLSQTFKTYEDGELIEHKVENSRFTIGNDKMTICNNAGTSCETSHITMQDNKLIIKGRDVTNKCYILLESTK